MHEVIRFEQGKVERRYLREVAQAVSHAFRAKHSALRVAEAAANEVLAVSINPLSAVFAYRGESFAGVAGLVTNFTEFLHLGLARSVRHLGPLAGMVYYLVARADSRVTNGEVKIQALAVTEGMRGEGIGGCLLREVERVAGARGFRFLSLDVVDTNAVARRLYERIGFEIVGNTPFRLLRHRLTFTNVYHMRKQLAPRASGCA
jgi:ribosomal protein S18 acetylase RimI-like enzyme